jgi:hypothetical protein
MSTLNKRERWMVIKAPETEGFCAVFESPSTPFDSLRSLTPSLK